MIQVVTAALIQHERLLLGHRSAGRASCPSVWDLPGGHVELGEAPLDALVREATEELGIQISPPAARPLARLHLFEAEPSFELAIWVVTLFAHRWSNRFRSSSE